MQNAAASIFFKRHCGQRDHVAQLKNVRLQTEDLAQLCLLYVVYFFAGLGVGAYGLERGLLRSDGMLAPHWPIWLVGTLAAFLLWIIPTALTVNGPVTTVSGLEIVANFGLVLCCAAACLGWAAIFLRFGTTRRPIIDNLSESAYGIYLVHYLFITWLQYILLGVALFAIAKAAIVFTGTLVLSWATTAAMCRVPIGGRLVGANRRSLARAR